MTTIIKGGKGTKGNVAEQAAPPTAEALLAMLAKMAPEALAGALAGLTGDALATVAKVSAEKTAAEKKAADDKKRADIDGRYADELTEADEVLAEAVKARQAIIDKRADEYRAAGLMPVVEPKSNGNGNHGTGTKRGEGVRDALAAWLKEAGPKTLAECQAHIWATHSTYAEARSKEATDKPAYYKGLNTCENSVKWYLTTAAPKGLGLTAVDGKFSV